MTDNSSPAVSGGGSTPPGDSICMGCGESLAADAHLSLRFNRFRAWVWRLAHKLNCGKELYR